MICSNLPLYFIPEDLLEMILRRADLNANVHDIIMRRCRETREAFAAQKAHHPMHLVLPALDRSQFERSAPGLALADLFLDEQITLTCEEYAACTDALKAAAEHDANLHLEFDPSAAFHNINITIFGEKMVIVSKEKSPAIHFVIHHKKMIRAFRNFIPPVTDR